MSASTGTGWAQLRQQARSLETQTESLFHTYSQFAQISNIPPSPTEEQKQTESKIDELFEKRETLINQLTRLLDSESTLTASALKQNNLSRHHEVLQNDRREFSSLKSTLQSARQRANLLTNVRSDIDAYHASSPSAEADYMLSERNRIENSHNMADSVLSQAYAVNEQFGLQRETLAGIQQAEGYDDFGDVYWGGVLAVLVLPVSRPVCDVMGSQLLAAVIGLKVWAGIPTQAAREARSGCKWWQGRR
ncbi:hypothetical protein V496_04947 [Pseudogymnoascus sp. VKM F-4515 (FW-2607)]|nr:hypothetical protein V496_04947 [Pseudogymnoascus sp. VKM F-4515 (FW-2607)]KFY77093.1 hypothetical protein V498_09437 [Pseudogymnoascus sp. VKM F-4517 (FW-2822)]